MKTKTRLAPSGLTELLPGAPFSEQHSGIVAAPREQVWDALHGLRWDDLPLARPLMGLRIMHAPAAGERFLDTFTKRANGILVQEPPRSVWLAMVGKPWSPVPQHADVTTIDDVAAFDEPGWLRYGMDWLLHDLGDERTLVETRTLCDPTDTRAHRAFSIYWALIRIGSGAIRRDMIATLRRLTESR